MPMIKDRNNATGIAMIRLILNSVISMGTNRKQRNIIIIAKQPVPKSLEVNMIAPYLAATLNPMDSPSWDWGGLYKHYKHRP